MKKLYVPPAVEWLALFPTDGVLNNASNEGYPVDDGSDIFASATMNNIQMA